GCLSDWSSDVCSSDLAVRGQADAELGVGLTAYGVLSRGLISGHWSAGHAAGPGDRRGFSPRFASGNVEHNLALVEALRRVAEAKDRKSVVEGQAGRRD